MNVAGKSTITCGAAVLAREFCRSPARRRVLKIAGAATLLACIRVPARAAEPQATSDPRAFIDTLGSQVIAIIQQSGITQTQRQQEFRELFTRNFDVPSIARFVVGRYWSRAAADEQSQYIETFRDYVAAIYAEQFSHYSGEGFKSTGTRSLGEGESVVRSEIDRQGNPPIALEFRVKGAAGSYKITDVTVEGVSLIVTKRDEFSSVLARDGLKGVIGRMQAALKQTQSAG
jgi:phospholipid transport system substrate-binding protein